MLANLKDDFLLDTILSLVGYTTASKLLVSQEEKQVEIISLSAYKKYLEILSTFKKDAFLLGIAFSYVEILCSNVAVPAIKLLDKETSYYFLLEGEADG